MIYENGEFCHGCHWYHPEGSPVKCSNLSMDGWKPHPECRCEEYVRTEDYQPTGIWAAVANVVQKIEQQIEVNSEQG